MAGEFEAGGSIMEESLAAFEELGDERGVAIVKHRLGIAALNANDLAHGRALLEASLQTCRHLPDPKLEGDVLRGLAVVEQLDGNAARALEFYEQSIELLERIGHTWVLASALRSNAELLHELGETSRAEDRARESLRLSHELLDRQATVYSLALLAGLAVTAGNLGRAGRLWGALDSEAARGPVGYWEAERDEYETRVVRQGPEFEGGCEAGRRLSLDEAVELALSVDSPA
jgi:tetratricopeptide (TPR) repeat protein